MGTTVQGHQATAVPEVQGGISTQAYQPGVSDSVANALNIFSVGQAACIRAQDQLAGPNGIFAQLVKARQSLDNVSGQISQKRAAFVVEHDWAQYAQPGQNNDEWRQAKLETSLFDDEEYVTWNDQHDEYTNSVRELGVQQEILSNAISIGRSQMAFATALLNAMSK